MTKEEHKKRHVELHNALDELLADYIYHTGNLPSKTSVMELTEWSAAQRDNPTDDDDAANQPVQYNFLSKQKEFNDD